MSNTKHAESGCTDYLQHSWESCPHNPKRTMKHHPSCTPNDVDLVWHCSQCGEMDSAADIEQRYRELERSVMDLSHPNIKDAYERGKRDAMEAAKFCPSSPLHQFCEKVAKLYFEIAAEAIGEEEVRRRRDKRLEAMQWKSS